MPRFAGCCLVGIRPVAMTTCTATTWPSASWRSSVSGPSCKIMCALGWRIVRRPFAGTYEGERLVKINKTNYATNLYVFVRFLLILLFCYILQVQLIYYNVRDILFYLPCTEHFLSLVLLNPASSALNM